MELSYTYWKDGAFFVGFLNDYPEDSTQGLSLPELEEALLEVYEIKQEEKNTWRQSAKQGRSKFLHERDVKFGIDHRYAAFLFQ